MGLRASLTWLRRPVCALLLSVVLVRSATAQPMAMLRWSDLAPPGQAVEAAAPPIHDYLAVDDPLSLTAYQPKNFAVIRKLNGKGIQIRGFIVPLNFNGAGRVVSFLLVPFYGACIHVPPPPPNQLILVRSAAGVPLKSLSTPYVVAGRLSVGVESTDLGTAGYRLESLAVSLAQGRP